MAMLKLFKTAFSSIAIILMVNQGCFSQAIDTIPDIKGEVDGFMKLNDGVIKREIAFFNIASSFTTETDSFPKIKVNEIPLLTCTDSSASFSDSNITVQIYGSKFIPGGHKLTYVKSPDASLILIDDKPFWETDGEVPNEKIKSVVFRHGKYQMTLPDNAISDLYEPNFCTKNRGTGTTTFHCKVYRSDDKKRVYIYMVNSDGAGGYEVTWVIQDSKYYTRVVDYGF